MDYNNLTPYEKELADQADAATQASKSAFDILLGKGAASAASGVGVGDTVPEPPVGSHPFMPSGELADVVAPRERVK